MSKASSLPPNTTAVKKRLILAPQSAGRIGKSTAAEAIVTWCDFAAIDAAVFDLDDEHQTLSQRFPEIATVFPEAVKHEEGWVRFMDGVSQVDIPLIICDLPAQSTAFLLKQLTERNGLNLLAASGIRLTVLIFPVDDTAARESAIECVKVLGERVDWLVIRQPGPKPLISAEQWAKSSIGLRLKELGAGDFLLPQMTRFAFEEIDRVAQEEGRRLSISEAIPRVGLVAQFELEMWRNFALTGCEDMARLLIPDLELIQKKATRLQAPEIYQRPKGPVFDL
jgi:hypothetical protein